MLIGLTYDLRQEYLDLGFGEEETAEFDKEDTIEGIENALRSLGYETDRIGNIWSLIRRIAGGDKWDLVFNIAEGLRGISREGQVPSVLEAYDIPYVFSDPFVLSLTLHKGMAKRIFRDLGLPTPGFYEIHSPEDIKNATLPYPLFAKPIAEGTGKGIDITSRINNEEELHSICSRLLAKFNQPVLVETYLPGREFTVGIVASGKDSRSVGIMEIILGQTAEKFAYSYSNKENWQKHVEYRRADDPEAVRAVNTALEAWKGLGCRDGGRVDLRSDGSGVPNIIEINPLAGINPHHSDLPIICKMNNITYNELIGMIIESALKRIGR